MSRLVAAPLLALATASALAALPAPAHAQAQQRAYAPEDLWTLSPAEQSRVIGLEYREQSRGRQIPDDQLRFYLDQVRLSRWTFSQVKNDIAKSLGGAGAPPPPPGPGPGMQTARCESTDGRAKTCSMPWQGPSRLTRQLSSAACVEGRSWFNGNGRVTVSNGCRGEFQPGTGPVGTQWTTLRCESIGGRFTSCGHDVVGRAQLVRQLSNGRCIENRNFGVRNRQLWVSDGCRGEFRVQVGAAPGSDYSVTCTSRGGYATCAWDARRGRPTLIQQLAGMPCREGFSWGYEARSGLWVNHGCSARFGVR